MLCVAIGIGSELGARRSQVAAYRRMRCARRSLPRGKSHTISSGSELAARRSQVAA